MSPVERQFAPGTNPVAQQFAVNLTDGRDKAEITQEALSHLSGLHRTEISQLERGFRIPRIDTVAKLTGGLDLPPGTLMDGIIWKPPKLATGEFLFPSLPG